MSRKMNNLIKKLIKYLIDLMTLTQSLKFEIITTNIILNRFI